MSILLSFEKISGCSTRQEKSEKYKSLYRINSIFRSYVDLCYNNIPLSKTPPLFFLDDAPAGLNTSCLEQQYKKFRSAFYDSSLNKQVRMKMGTQVFESINILEVEFLEQVLKGAIKGFSRKELESMNATV